MKHLNLSLILLFFTVKIFAQAAVGEWTDFLSFASAEKVVQAGDKIFCITTGGLFSYDQTDNSIQKLNQINGLSDVNPIALAYGEEADVVIVAYGNSNLDLITKDDVYNISAIKRKQIQGDKKIYSILVAGQTAFLSCGFGVVAVNLEKHEIKDTYYIGADGGQVVVLDMAFNGTYLYAATNEGIYKADINAANLQDFHNWVKDETIPHASERFDQIEFYDGKIFASYNYQIVNGNLEDKSKLYVESNNEWDLYFPDDIFIKRMQVCNNQLIISRGSEVDVYETDNQLVDKINSYSFVNYSPSIFDVKDAIIDKNGILWLADVNNGLVRESDGNDELVIPQGPPNNKVFSMVSNGNDLWVAAGGRDLSWNNVFTAPQFELYRGGSWTEFSYRNYEEMTGFHDIVNLVVDPKDPDHVFAGSWGAGVLEFHGDKFVDRYNQFNSTLQTALPNDEYPNFVRIGGMAFDSQNNLWVTNSIVSKPLSVRYVDGSWEAYSLKDITGDDDVGNIVIADNDDQWIIIPRGENLYVRKGDGTDGRHLSVVAYFNNGEEETKTPMSDIYSIAVDLDGAIWVGTSQGVAVYFNPDEIWDSSTFYANQPGVDLNDGIYHPLLEKETVTAIAVDGANRKWIGTASSGVYLISADGQHELANFNESNSPLLSNSVNSIAINDNSGEVFFGTTNGIISYRGTAIKGKETYADVYAFPNPVREDYDGDIVITGLVASTDVKITDISGNLVYKTTSLGGQAVWDGKNLNGNRVSTGVYMVFGNDKLGEQTFTTKILFIH